MVYQNSDPSQTQIVNGNYLLYNIPIYKLFNEKSAVFAMSVRPNNGDLGVSIAPSTLKGTTGKQTVVEKGAKVYDYTREITSNLIYSDCVKLKEYIENLVINRKEKYAQTYVLSTILNSLTNIDPNILNSVNGMLNEEISKYILPNQGDKDNKNGILIYRNTEVEKKLWTFNITSANDGNAMMYISAVKNNDNNSRVYMGLGEKSIIPFYYALKSYIENYSAIQCILETFRYLLNEINKVEVLSVSENLSKLYGENFEAYSNNPDTKRKLENLRSSLNYTIHNCIFSGKEFRKIINN